MKENYTDGWKTFITHPYTIEERSLLPGFIQAEITRNRVEIANRNKSSNRSFHGVVFHGCEGEPGYTEDLLKFNENFVITTENVTLAAFKICALPLTDIPLHVNDEDPIIRGVVKWRLSIAK